MTFGGGVGGGGSHSHSHAPCLSILVDKGEKLLYEVTGVYLSVLASRLCVRG